MQGCVTLSGVVGRENGPFFGICRLGNRVNGSQAASAGSNLLPTLENRCGAVPFLTMGSLFEGATAALSSAELPEIPQPNQASVPHPILCKLNY